MFEAGGDFTPAQQIIEDVGEDGVGEGQLVSTDFQTEGRHLIWAWSFSWSFVFHLRGRGSSDGLGDGCEPAVEVTKEGWSPVVSDGLKNFSV